MPFCRECGKGVEDDWVTCPFCSQPIGSPAAKIAEISDTVVMGDVNVNDSESISTAVKHASKCPVCDSLGTSQTACLECKSIAYCNVCEKEELVKVKRIISYKISAERKNLFPSTHKIHELEDRDIPRFCLLCANSKPKCISCKKRFIKDERLENWNAMKEWDSCCDSCSILLIKSKIMTNKYENLADYQY